MSSYGLVDMEERQHLATSTVARRLSTIIGFYRFAVIDGLLDRSPTNALLRRPHHNTRMGGHPRPGPRWSSAPFIAQAGAAGPMDHALACLLGLLGMRVSEACNGEHREPGHGARAPDGLHHRQGQQACADPACRRGCPEPSTRLAATGSRGPLLLFTRSGRRLDRHARHPRPSAGWPSELASPSASRRIRSEHSFITAALDAGVPLRDVADRGAPPPSPGDDDPLQKQKPENNLDRTAPDYIVTAFMAGAASQ